MWPGTLTRCAGYGIHRTESGAFSWAFAPSCRIRRPSRSCSKKAKLGGDAAALVREKARSRALLLKLGTKRFGPADAATEAAVNALDDLDHLDRLAVALLDVTTWAELLATA